MKAFQVVISILILAALLVSGYVAWMTYKDMQKAAAPLPIEKFEAHLKQRDVNPIKVHAWTRTNDGAYLLTEIVTPDTTITYTQMEFFWELDTPAGKEWFHDDEGTMIKVENIAAKK